MSLNIKFVAFALFPIEHMSNRISKLSHSVYYYPVSQLLLNLGCTNKKTLIRYFTEKYIVMLLTKTASTQRLFNPVFPRYTIPLTVCLTCTAVMTDKSKSVLTMTTFLLCVCLGTCWLNCGCLRRHLERHACTHTHRRWAHPPARHSLIPPFEPCWVLWYGTPRSANFSVCLSGCGQQNYSTLRSHFTEADYCERMCEKTNHWKPHPVKHGMWIHVPCILAHHVLIGKGCGFERSVEECEGMA